MKKLLAVVLSLCILVSGITTALFGGVSASAEGSVFDDPANWVRYAFNTTHINSEKGTVPTWGSVAKNTNTAYTYNADASSIKIAAKLQLSTVEFDVKANTDYELTYRFLAVGSPYNSNGKDCYLVRTGVADPNGSVSSGQDGYYAYMATNASYTAADGVYAKRINGTAYTSDWATEGVWHKVTINFNSGSLTKLKLVVQAGADTFYVDDFALTSKIDFENVTNWGIYSDADSGSDTAHAVIDGSGVQKHGWMSVTNDTANTAEGVGKSVKLNGNTTVSAIMLPGLKANTKYNLTFKYYIPENSTWGSSTKAWFIPGIVKKDTAISNKQPASFVLKGTAPATTAGSWYDYTLTFTTDDTVDYAFTMYATFASGFNIYLDDMALNEAERPTYLIQDFEDYVKSKSEYVGALSIVTPDGTSVSGTKALQYDGTAEGANTAEGSNRVIINPSNSNLPTLAELVNKGSKFKVTLKYKLLSGEVKFYMNSATDGTNAWALASTNPISYKSTTLSAGDTWQEFSYEFTLKEDAADGQYLYPMFLIGGVGKAYFDYIAVSTVNAVVPDVEIPSEVTPDAFEDIANWGIYHKDAKGDYAGYATVDGTAPAKRDWAGVTINENTAYTVTDSDKSVKVRGNTVLNTVKLNELKANTAYTLNFKYLIPKDYTWGGSSKAWFNTYIVKKGVAMNGANASEYFVTGAKATTPASPSDGSWQDFTIEFTTDSTTEFFFALYPTFASGFDIYLDEFELSEKTTTPEPEPEPEPEPSGSSYDNASAWGVYHSMEHTVLDGSADQSYSWIKITDNTDKAYTYNGGASSLKYNGNTTLAATKLQNLEKGKTYTVAFKYYAPSTSTMGPSSKAWCSQLGIYAGGVAVVNHSPATAVAKGTNLAGAADQWNDFTMSFTVEDSTDLYFGIVPTFGAGYILYIDEFSVTEGAVTPEPEPEPDPEPDPVPSGSVDYDDAANWLLYHSDQGASTINGSGLTKYSWISNTQNTDKAYTYNGGEKSIKFNGNIQFTAIRLSDLEKGKAYKVSFKYFAPTTSTVGSSSKAWVNQAGIVSHGTAMKGNSPEAYVKKGELFAGEAGQWHEYSMLFRADSTDLYFGMTLTFASGFILYLDDFTVAETTEDPDAVPVVPGKEPKDKVIIDFDNYGGNANVYPKDRIEIVDAEAYDGSTSKMLHFKKGQYSSATTLNFDTTYATDTDEVFTIGVKPNKVYNLSFRVKTNSQTLPEGAKAEWIGIYGTFGKKYLVSSYQHSAKRDEWLYYEYPVTTSADQNLLSFYINAGESTPDMWIDDITLTETDYEPFTGWGDEPRDEILINFDDFYVNYDIACASIVDGPERDGKVSKATYLKGGDYTYNTVANYSAVTQYRDPVFTVPCKENTLYEFSYYIYIPKDTGSLTYFAVYYDWSNTWVLRASGMTERDQWVKKTIRFTTKAGQTKLSFTFNGGKVIPDIYLDDICLKELKPGTSAYTDLTYCENDFNVFELEGLTDRITSSKSTVIKIPIRKQLQYSFGLTVSSSKKSNSRVFLSFDGVNPMPQGETTSPSAIISADGTSKRYGIDFISDVAEYVYLVIENDDGALTISDPMLFTTKSLSADILMGKDAPVMETGLSVNNGGPLTELVVFGSETVLEDGTVALNPETGSETVVPVIILFFTLLVACAILVKSKKGGEQA